MIFFYRKRKEIITSFTGIYGNLDVGQKDEADEHASSELQRHNHFQQKEKNYQLTKPLDYIVKLWLARAVRMRIIRGQVAGLLEELTNKECYFCGINYGLRAESLDHIEDLYEAYKRLNFTEININQDIINWQAYFKKNVHLRTICYSCSNELLNHQQTFINSKTALIRLYPKPEPKLKHRLTKMLTLRKTESFVSSVDSMPPNKYLNQNKRIVLEKLTLRWINLAKNSLSQKKRESV